MTWSFVEECLQWMALGFLLYRCRRVVRHPPAGREKDLGHVPVSRQW